MLKIIVCCLIFCKSVYGKCETTKDSKDNFQPCVFPFKFQGKTYNGCTTANDKDNRPWCSTNVDSNGVHISGGDFWGWCNDDCPKENDVTSSDCQKGKNCQPAVVCASQLTKKEIKENVCEFSDGSKGLCCNDRSNVNINAISFSSKPAKKKHDDPFGVRNAGLPIVDRVPEDVMKAAEFAADIFSENFDDEESNIISDIKNKKTPEFKHSRFLKQTPQAAEAAKLSSTMVHMGNKIKENLGTEFEEDAEMEGLENTNQFEACERLRAQRCNARQKYRTIDGSCNNLRVPAYGQAFTPLQRIFENAYDDKHSLPRTKGKSGEKLPSARKISLSTTGRRDNFSPDLTALIVPFGQFIDHDLDFVPLQERHGEGLSIEERLIECCREDTRELIEPKTEFEKDTCFPVEIEKDDKILEFFQKASPTSSSAKYCLNFVRSTGSPRMDCKPGAKEQLNQITHWLDSSNVYGSVDRHARDLRTLRDGLLNTTIGDDGSEQLPFDDNRNVLCPDQENCPFAGDFRVFENPMLGSMHILFVREHNRIARILKEKNPSWNDERLYQESRRIVNAQYQHIIFNEWLPVILGQQFLKRTEMQPLTRGFSNAYDNTFDPRVTNEFAAAGFRVGHTWVPNVIQTFNRITREPGIEFDLKKVFNLHELLRSNNMVDKILEGLTIQFMQEFDNNFVEDITDHLFDEPPRGADLLAFNIQRARDHGLPSYIEYRDECLGTTTTSFDDLAENIPRRNINLLKNVYEDVEDIDLFVGAIQERPTDGDATIGSTFLCIIGDMFGRLRFGDRFFYDQGGQTGSFTEDQLNQIRKTSMARILCDNTDIERIQPLAFRKADDSTNKLQRCDSRFFLGGIPSMDMTVFENKNY